jgi:uncharacterized damage-inducible protein DinB
MTPEINGYLGLIEDLRGQVADLIANLPAEALNWRPVEGQDEHATNSLAVMAAHVAGAEHFWIYEVCGQQPPTRDRPAEFKTAVDGPGPLLARLAEVGEETRRIFSGLTGSKLDEIRQVQDRQVGVRWGILHVIDHTALHLGHMQITYQLWQGGQAADSPRWFQRLGD